MHQPKENKFWEWFSNNNLKYIDFENIKSEKNRDNLHHNFLKNLHLYCDKLFYKIYNNRFTKNKLIITAAGNKKYFNNVEQLVNSAPPFDNWKIIAFKPPIGTDFVLENNGSKIHVENLWFLPVKKESVGRFLGIKIFFSNYSQSERNQFLYTAYEILDGILGEKSSALDIHQVDVDALPADPVIEGLIEMFELPDYMEWYKSKINQRKN